MTEKFKDDYIKNCPKRLPKGFLDWIREEILPNDATILYQKGGWRGKCYVCGRDVRAQSQTLRFKSYITRTCPDCGTHVTCYLSGGAAWKEDKVANVVCAQLDKNGVLWFRMFHLMRDYTAKYKNLKNCLEECVRYAFKPNATGYWEHYHKFAYGIGGTIENRLHDWTKNDRFNIYDGFYDFYPGADKTFFSKTHLKYFAADKFLKLANKRVIHDDIIKYAHLCSHYAIMEFLIKNDFYKLINQRMRGGKEINNAVLWKRKQLKECFRFPIQLLKTLDPMEWSDDILIRANKLIKIMPAQKITYDILTCGYSTDHLVTALKYMSLDKYQKHVKSYLYADDESKYNEGMYHDYILECEKLKLDLKSNMVLFPKDLQAAHARTSAMVEYEENKEMFEKFKKVAKSLEKNCYKSETLLIRPAADPAELKCEGAKLHHCVGGYAERMATKQTQIYFIRKTDEPDKPYFTLELRGKTIIQCRTLHNRSYDTEKEVKEFALTWLENVIRKTKAKKSA